MYPNRNSSQPHHSATGGNHHQLTRYGSAPSSVFDSSDIFLSPAGIHSSSSQSNNNNSSSSNNNNTNEGFGIPAAGVSSNLTMSTAARGVGSSSSSMHPPPPALSRHSSSPPGFLNHLTASNTGFTLTNGGQSYSNSQATSSHGELHKPSRFGTQLNFTNQLASNNSNNQSSLKRASSLQSSSNGFSISSWESGSSLAFGGSSSKRGKTINGGIDLLSGFSDIDSQMELSEMGVMENMMHIPENSVACKVRAKRGFATHPRSIAERDRRTRISGKLKKLQELVPNMDKQTSYSEMLDLAIQHIQGLQFQIQKLNEDVNKCTCGCKPKS